MLEYLTKSILCLLVLFGFYKVFLESESMHTFKRFYLLGAVIFALILPLITISYSVEVPANPESGYNFFAMEGTEENLQVKNKWMSYLWILILGIYLIGVVLFALRFFRNIRSINREISSNMRLRKWNYIFVLIRQQLVPHTFLNYIFLNREDYDKNRISASVLEHEKAHVDQKHSLDIILIEFLQVLFWFNPIFIWLKTSVKLNHEFLADRQVLSKEITAFEYSNLLFNYSQSGHHNALSSSINNSLTRLTLFGKTYFFGNSGGQVKKRILMISKKSSLKRILSRIGFLIPALALCIYFFNNDIIAKPVISESDNTETIRVSDLIQDPEIISIKVNNEKILVNGKEVSLKDFSEHLDALVSDKSDAEIKEMNFNMQTQNAENGILNLLDEEYRKTRFSRVTGHSILPPPPPAPPVPGDVPPPPPAPRAEGNMPVPPPAPPAPEVGKNIPVPPPAPKVIPGKVPPAPATPREIRKRDSVGRHHLNNKRVQIREQIRMEREMHRTEIEKERERIRNSRRDSLKLHREEVMLTRMEERKAEIAKTQMKIKERQTEIQAAQEQLKNKEKN